MPKKALKKLTNNAGAGGTITPATKVYVVCDVGNSIVKIMLVWVQTFKVGGDTKTYVCWSYVTYPHAIRRLGKRGFEDIQLRAKRGVNAATLDKSIFMYKDDAVMIGENAEATAEPRRTGGPKFQKDYYPYLFLHGLLRLLPDGHENIHAVMLFPPGDHRFVEDLMNTTGGVHTVTQTNGKRVTYKIKHVDAVDEPVGGLTDYLLYDNGLTYRTDNIDSNLGLCVDFGGKISNLVPFRKDGFVDYNRARSVDLGVQDVMNNVSDILLNDKEFEKYFKAKRGDRLPHDGAMRRALTSKIYSRMGFDIPVTEVIQEAMKPIIREAKEVYDQDFEGGDGFFYVIVSGGGGGLMYYEIVSQVLTNFNAQKVYMSRPDVDMMYVSNLIGATKMVSGDILDRISAEPIVAWVPEVLLESAKRGEWNPIFTTLAPDEVATDAD